MPVLQHLYNTLFLNKNQVLCGSAWFFAVLSSYRSILFCVVLFLACCFSFNDNYIYVCGTVPEFWESFWGKVSVI
jgi:hypothetical protein